MSDDESTTSEESKSSEVYQSVVLLPTQIVGHMANIVDRASSVLQLPPTTARMLLNHFNWDQEKMLKEFFEDDDHDQLFRKANVINPFKQISSTANDEEEEECSVCFMDVTLVHITGLGCGHSVCEVCWNMYLTTKIVYNGIGQTITCIGERCPILVDYETVMRLVQDENVKIQYQRLITNGFVESNRLTRWCPSPGCEYAIEVEHVKSVPMVCKCGHTFCFSCGENWHDPINCTMLKKWIKKCNDNSEMSIWLSKNTKQCPACKTAIEKNGGCNHMVCRKVNCKAEFCWVCLVTWAAHGNACDTNYEEEAEAASNPEEQSREELNRHAFFFNRYVNHQRCLLRLDESVYPSAIDRLGRMLRSNTRNRDLGICEVYLRRTLNTAMNILRECRQTLTYVTVFAYYLKKNNQSLIFEKIYNDLEGATESLSEYLERDKFTSTKLVFKKNVEHPSLDCKRKQEALLRYVHEGYEKEWWLPED